MTHHIKLNQILGKGQFDSWYECSNQGYSLAYDFNKSMGKDRVNEEKTIVNFSCQEFDSI